MLDATKVWRERVVFGIQNYASFIAAILIFQIIPGAGTITILNATARNGITAGLGAALGTLSGDFLFMVAAIAGLAGLLQTNPIMFQALQWFGAAYLCWMGIQLLRARLQSANDCDSMQKSARIYFKQGFLVSLTNPKVILFFVAFFPLFMRADSSMVTLTAMMLHVTSISLVYQVFLVILGNVVAQRLKGLPSARRMATQLAGLALVGFGIKLAAGNR